MPEDPRAHPAHWYVTAQKTPPPQTMPHGRFTFHQEFPPGTLSTPHKVSVSKWHHCFQPNSHAATSISQLPAIPPTAAPIKLETTTSFPLAPSNYVGNETFNNTIATPQQTSPQLQQQLHQLQQQHQVLLQQLARQAQPRQDASVLNNGEICYGGIPQATLDSPVIPEHSNPPTESILTPAPFGCFKAPGDALGKITSSLCPVTFSTPISPSITSFNFFRSSSLASSSIGNSMSPNIAYHTGPSLYVAPHN